MNGNVLTKTMCVLAMMFAGMALAVEVTPEQAQTAVRNWIRNNPSPMQARFATGNGEAKTFEKDGKALFHVVQLDGGGFVVTSGDTRISPIVAFSAGGDFDSSKENPLLAALECDMSARFSSILAGESSTGRARLQAKASSATAESPAEREWSALLALPASAHTAKSVGTSAITDMRVEPIVKTSWGQSYWNSQYPSEAVFNLHTPTCPCGCVATAAAQVMRTMRFPDRAITPQSFTCSMESREETHKMYGGTYEWDLMPYSVLEAAALSTPQKEAIGKLTWDIGAAVQMNYTSGNSTAGMGQLHSALVDVFGFKSANLLGYGRLCGSPADAMDAAVLFSSLDAGLPVFGGIFQRSSDGSTAGGHCVLFDGYGFIGTTPYVHMNCGYNGTADVWYAFFTEYLVKGARFKYNFISSVIYNVDSREAGDVISGRVLDTSGAPVPYADVSLRDSAGGLLKTTRSSSRGIWSFRVPIGPGTHFVSAATATAASQSSRVVRGGTVTPDGSTSVVGNRWGFDLTLEEIPLEQVETPLLNPSTGGFSGSSVSVTISCGTAGATIRYTRDGTEPTASSTRYSSAIYVSGTTTIRAKAFKDGMRPSETATVVYEQNIFKGASDLAAAIDCKDSSLVFSSKVYYSFRGSTYYFDSQKVAERVYGQTQETFDGVDAVLLKACPSSTGFTYMWGATTELSTSIRGPGLLRFKYKLLKDVHNGYLTCSVNGTEMASFLTEPEWTSVAIAVTGTGDNTIAWKVGSFTGGALPSSLDDARACIVLDDMEWIPGTVSKRSLTYNLNGDVSGLSSPASVNLYPGEKVTVPVDAGYRRNGYVFGGWNTEPDGSGVSYWPKSSFVFGESDMVLYARWCKIVEVPFDYPSEGGTHSFPLKGFSGSMFHCIGTFPNWASYATTGANGNIFVGGSTFANQSFADDVTLHISADENSDPEERSFSWGVISETYNEVPMFICRQYGDTSHVLDGLVVDGPESVVAGTSVGLSATAHYRDGTSARVSGCTWVVSSGTGYAEVSSAGLLTGKSVTAASVVTVSATYGEGGVQLSAERSFVVLPSVAIGASLNAETTTFRTGTGSAAWVGQQGVSADGISAARCGSCLNASPWLEFTLPKGRPLSFACRLSEGIGRNLTIYVDGQAVGRFISAVDMSDWLSWEIASANSARTIRIVYQWHGPKGALATEEDCAWIDYINFGDKPHLDELNWGYRIVNGGAIVTNASLDVTGDVVIPNTLGGVPVVSIGFLAFEDRKDITSVTFPDTVTNIGFGAFFDCSGLVAVKWPMALKFIDDMAFYFTSITELMLPEGLGYIGESAFEFSLVRSALIPRTVASIGESAFSYCNYLTNVTFGGNAPHVGSSAFSDVGNGCIAHVPYGATGYDVDSNGRWNGLKVVRSAPITITFNANGGKFSNGAATKTVEATPGNLWGKMPMPAMSGQVFDGWYTSASGGTMVTASSAVPNDSTTYYAHWTPRLGLAAASEWGGAFDTDTWCGQGRVAHDGKDALRSGIIYDGQSSYLVTRVSGSGVLTFWWAVSCEGGGKDALRFLVDGEQKELISGNVDWTKVELPIRGVGTHILKWNYTKNGSVTKGEDFGWIDQISWTGSDVDSFVFDANGGKFSNGATVKKTDAPEGNLWGKMYMPAKDGQVFAGWYTAKEGGNLVTASDKVPFYYTTYYAHWTPRLGLAAASEWSREFTTDNWCGQGAVSHDGRDALRSGIIYDGQSSYILTRVPGPGVLTFWWKVSCEAGGNDALRFLVDGEQKAMITGEIDWKQVSISITGSGTHTLKWNYTKNGTITKGEDFGWIDQISWRSR